MFVQEEAAQGALGGGSAEPIGELPLERLEHEITELAAHINAGSCRFLELVAEYDRRNGWWSWGTRSCGEWVAWQCGLKPRAAREQVRVARALEHYPAVHQAFARGELSYSKVRALTRMGDGYSEEELIGLARDATAAQLERIARVVRRVSAAEANNAHAERYLTYRWEEDGSLSIHARLPAEDGAVVLEASSGPPRRVPSPAIEGGAAIAAETARRVACDASLITIHERDSEPLSVGRKTRTIPPSIRRALGSRDPTCRYPGCERRRFLDAHHIHHWAHGGETKLDNLIHLCRHHHRLVHEGGVSISVSPEGRASFEAPAGRFLPPAPSVTPTHPGALAAGNAQAGQAIDQDTCQGGAGEKLDLDLAVRI